jgi:hypothetical protein
LLCSPQNGLRGLSVDSSLGDGSLTKGDEHRVLSVTCDDTISNISEMKAFITTPYPANPDMALACLDEAMAVAALPAANLGLVARDWPATFTGDMGGFSLGPGVYTYSIPIGLTGAVTLNGGANDVWIFQIDGALTVAADSEILLTGGASTDNVFWYINAAATIGAGTTTNVKGTIMASGAISVGANPLSVGANAKTQALLSSVGAITLGADATAFGALVGFGAITLGANARATSVTTPAAKTFGAGACTTDGVVSCPTRM